MSSPESPIRTVAMPWFDAASYQETRAAMADPDKLADAYPHWLLSAEQIEGEMKRVGFEVRRVPIERIPFLAWCEAQSRAPDGPARAAYAAKQAGS